MGMVRVLACSLVVLVVGCGRLNYATLDGGTDAGVEPGVDARADADADAGDAEVPPPCASDAQCGRCERCVMGRCEPVLGPVGGPFVELALGLEHACARGASGEVVCWGANDSAQLGDGTSMPSGTPVRVRLEDAMMMDVEALAIAAGGDATCAIVRPRGAMLGSGALVCWGSNERGQIGSGGMGPQFTPLRVGLADDWISVGVGLGHACGVHASGVAQCWGEGSLGQLGNGGQPPRAPPLDVVGPMEMESIRLGDGHSCARLRTGRVACWGDDALGQVGDGSGFGLRTEPVLLSMPTSVIALASGGEHSCAIDPGGNALCWGNNVDAQLGTGGLPVPSAAPVRTAPTPMLGAIAAGADHSCAIGGAGEVLCWGANNDGQLGLPTPDGRSVPTRIAVPPAIAIAAGTDVTCMIDVRGAVLCWGANDVGQLGRGFESTLEQPDRVCPR